MKLKYILLLALAATIFSCSKENDNDEPVVKTVSILSEKDLDGHVINSSPKTVKNSESRIDMGWTGGSATRAFLSYDITSIIPSSDKVLKIDKVILKVYEKNTNMLPFNGGETTRVIEAYTLNYGTLDATDFDLATADNCGVITNWGYSVLKEYTLDVTQATNNFLTKYASTTKLQFRLQFTNNENVNPTTSTLAQAMWSLYSGEDQGTYNDYRPAIEITYKWVKK